jgi:hypothetical protein
MIYTHYLDAPPEPKGMYPPDCCAVGTLQVSTSEAVPPEALEVCGTPERWMVRACACARLCWCKALCGRICGQRTDTGLVVFNNPESRVARRNKSWATETNEVERRKSQRTRKLSSQVRQPDRRQNTNLRLRHSHSKPTGSRSWESEPVRQSPAPVFDRPGSR